MKKEKFLSFTLLENWKLNQKWYIVCNKEEHVIGKIEKVNIFNKKRWCFSPRDNMYFTKTGLREIVNFISKLKRKRRK